MEKGGIKNIKIYINNELFNLNLKIKLQPDVLFHRIPANFKKINVLELLASICDGRNSSALI